jgi:hypothetical protein
MRYSVVAFAGTAIVVNAVQVAPKLDEPVGVFSSVKLLCFEREVID